MGCLRDLRDLLLDFRRRERVFGFREGLLWLRLEPKAAACSAIKSVSKSSIWFSPQYWGFTTPGPINRCHLCSACSGKGRGRRAFKLGKCCIAYLRQRFFHASSCMAG